MTPPDSHQTPADPDGPPFQVAIEGNVAVVRAGSSKLRLLEAQSLGKLIDGKYGDYERLLLNLTGVEFVDSSMVSLLVRVAAAKQLRVVGVASEVDRLLLQMGMRELFSLHETERSAMESFTG